MEDSRELRSLIAARILNGGPLAFGEFLELALYHPDHGYYAHCDPGLDYQSSPSVHTLFGECLAEQIADFWRHLGAPSAFTVFEAGAGRGRLALDILRALEESEPELFHGLTYALFDPFALKHHEGLAQPLDGYRAKVRVQEAFPERGEIDGCILSNELLDALPFDRVRVRDGRLYEIRTDFVDGLLTDVECEPSDRILAELRAGEVWPADGCLAEVSSAVPAWMARAGTALRRGYLLTLDYGYPVRELYATWRSRGTLLTFYRHTSGEDPYSHLGRQDITASVNLTAAAAAAEAAGLQTLGLTSQAEFLAALGIGSSLTAQPAANGVEAFYARRRGALELTDLGGLGRVQVLIQGKGVPDTRPRGLSLTARDHAT